MSNTSVNRERHNFFGFNTWLVECTCCKLNLTNFCLLWKVTIEGIKQICSDGKFIAM